MKIVSVLNRTPNNNRPYKITSSACPMKLYKMMKMYSKERKEHFPRIQAILNSLDTMFSLCRMRVAKDSLGNILAAYTYRFRKNRLGEKSMYIDALVRNFDKQESKNVMPQLYEDMKNIALKKKVKELSLFSAIKDKSLREKYRKLGFVEDHKTFIFGGYFMKTNTENFLK